VDLGDICVNTTGTSHTIILHVGAFDDRVRSVRSIRNTGDGLMLLSEVWATGNIGEEVDAPDFAIEVDRILTINTLDSILGGIKATGGGIGLIVAANVFADIVAEGDTPTGTIGAIEVSGQIGSSVAGNINIHSHNDTGTVLASRIYADIDTRVGGGNGNLTLLRTTGTTANIFRGSLVTKSIVGTATQHGLQVYGDLDANITIEEDVRRAIIVSGEFKPGKTLEIKGQMLNNAGTNLGALSIGTLGGTVKFTRSSAAIQAPVTIGTIATTGRLETSNTLETGRTISMTGYMDGLIKIGDSLVGNIDIDQSQGLRGQIIINGDAMTTPGTWTGSVLIGSLTLNQNQAQPYDAPYYDALPSVLGGGSVGLAPFRLHEKACTPPHGILVGERNLPRCTRTLTAPTTRSSSCRTGR